jgi:hypothetical protein
VRVDAVEDWKASPGDQVVGECPCGLGLSLLKVVEHVQEEVLEAALDVLVQVNTGESGLVGELALFGEALDRVAAR